MRRALIVALLVVGLGAASWQALMPEPENAPASPVDDAQGQIARGRYLAMAGNCGACHTTRGGAAFAGGRGIDTPFGTVYSSNITPDLDTGIGRWTSADFWRAMHHGRSRDGRLLYPAFPYPNYTLVTREDADAIHAYLRTLAPVRAPNRPHALRFPYNSQLSLRVWRLLFFSPGTFQPRPDRSAEWNRGAYLVQGLGHCDACHAPRNAFGATQGRFELGGGLIPMLGWYAPSLRSGREAGVADWDPRDVVALLKTGVSPKGSVIGPMAEVVYRSTQHLSTQDLGAIASFLISLPESSHPPDGSPAETPERLVTVLAQGRRLYQTHCEDCHGKNGEGAHGKYPFLAGNRAVTMTVPANVIRVVLLGGFPPGTAGNPRPYGMPPFAPFLKDDEVAAIVTYIRNAWGNRAGAVSPPEVDRLRGVRPH